MADPRLVWRRSSFCNGAATCVEVAALPDLGVVVVRDSKRPDGEPLVFTLGEWSAFTAGVKAGEFDTDTLRGRMDGSGVDGSPRVSGLPLAAS